jgi:hypothetical protein
VVLITNSPELQGYAGRALFRAAFDFDQQSNHFQLSAVAAWVLGEYGDVVVDQTTRLQGEVNTVVSEEDVVKLLESILGDIHAPSAVKQTAITALAKLGCRFKTQTRAVRGAMDKAGTSANVELQQRASEFCRIFDAGPALAAPLLERLPPFVMKSKEALHGVAGRGVHTGTAPAAPGAPSTGNSAGDLLGDLMAGYDATPSSAAAGGSVDPLADLMGGLSTQPAVGSSASGDPFAAMGSSIGGAAAPSPVDPLGDLMGMGAPAPTSAPTPAAFADPLSDLMGMGAPAAPPPPMNAAGSSPAATTLVAFSKDGVEVSFECTKPDVTDHSLTTVVATTRNLGGTPMTGYVLQCAVPKTMSLAMRTASGGELPVGGVVTQRLDVTNSQHGEKALAMRLRLAWNAGGGAVVEQATVNFPAGL